jgi:hypothetical protein
MPKSVLFVAATVGLSLTAWPTAGQDKGKQDPALNGDWALDGIYYVYTGRVKDALYPNTKHTLAVKDGSLVVVGEVDRKKTTVKYTLQTDASAKPKRYQQTNPANADDTESGVYWTDGKVLLVRIEKFGTASPKFEFSGIRMRLTDRAGNDADVPQGFLLREGAKGPRVLVFHKVTAKK